MHSPEEIRQKIISWLTKLFIEDSQRVSIVFSVAQTNVNIQSLNPGDLQQIRDKLDLRFKDNVRYIGVAHFHLTPLRTQLVQALNELDDIQEKLKLAFHIGVGAPNIDPESALRSASDAWKASLRLNDDGAIVNYSQFFSRDEVLDFILGKGQNKFILYFQPKICGSLNTVVAYEALARLKYLGDDIGPNRNNCRSCDFLEAISANGLQREFDFWLIKQVASLVNEKRNISVNLAASALTEDLAELITGTINPDALSCLDIEILEHEQLSKEPLETVKYLASKGVMFSVDDFGKGVSNIDVLRVLPKNSTLKVDFTFVKDSHLDTEEAKRKRQTQRAVASLAKIYGHNIVFEGVENEEIFDNLMLLISELEISPMNVKFQGYFRDGTPKPWGGNT